MVQFGFDAVWIWFLIKDGFCLISFGFMCCGLIALGSGLVQFWLSFGLALVQLVMA